MPRKPETPQPRSNPARLAIDRFSGVCALARALGCAPSVVSRWGKRGSIPQLQIGPVLAAAKREGVKLKAEELIP